MSKTEVKTTGQALYQSILEDPLDDDLRGIYRDWYLENIGEEPEIWLYQLTNFLHWIREGPQSVSTRPLVYLYLEDRKPEWVPGEGFRWGILKIGGVSVTTSDIIMAMDITDLNMVTSLHSNQNWLPVDFVNHFPQGGYRAALTREEAYRVLAFSGINWARERANLPLMNWGRFWDRGKRLETLLYGNRQPGEAPGENQATRSSERLSKDQGTRRG